jgi:hypothetical protein
MAAQTPTTKTARTRTTQRARGQPHTRIDGRISWSHIDGQERRACLLEGRARTPVRQKDVSQARCRVPAPRASQRLVLSATQPHTGNTKQRKLHATSKRLRSAKRAPWESKPRGVLVVKTTQALTTAATARLTASRARCSYETDSWDLSTRYNYAERARGGAACGAGGHVAFSQVLASTLLLACAANSSPARPELRQPRAS